MAELIRVDPDRIMQHASRVEAAAGRIQTAVSAASSMNMSGGAFGLMCAFMVPAATLASSMARGALQSSQQMLEESARELRGALRDIEAGEERVIEAVRALETDLDRGL